MSITLGIYDFFSYIIPGLLYLYVINDFLRIVRWNFVEINSWLRPDQAPNFVVLIVLLVVSFIVGHIFNPLAKELFDFVSGLSKRKGAAERSLMAITGRYPNLKIAFGPKDWSTLFVLIRLRNLDLSKFIDKFNADSLMLRNIAFALILFAVNYIVEFFVTGDWTFLITSV